MRRWEYGAGRDDAFVSFQDVPLWVPVLEWTVEQVDQALHSRLLRWVPLPFGRLFRESGDDLFEPWDWAGASLSSWFCAKVYCELLSWTDARWPDKTLRVDYDALKAATIADAPQFWADMDASREGAAKREPTA